MTKILRLPEVLAVTGLGRSTLYVKVRDGAFPKPVQLGLRSVGWPAAEVEEWVQARIRARRRGDGPKTA